MNLSKAESAAGYADALIDQLERELDGDGEKAMLVAAIVLRGLAGSSTAAIKILDDVEQVARGIYPS